MKLLIHTRWYSKNGITCIIYELPLSTWYLWQAKDVGMASDWETACQMASKNAEEFDVLCDNED
jgi:hypothetical protein